MEEIIKRRTGQKVIGFGTNIEEESQVRIILLSKLIPEDLQRFGLIPNSLAVCQ